MSFSRNEGVEPKEVTFDDSSFWVRLSDGRTVGVPLAWFPRLLRGTVAERNQFFLSPSGIHWEALDEDISIDGLLGGFGNLTKRRADAA